MVLGCSSALAATEQVARTPSGARLHLSRPSLTPTAAGVVVRGAVCRDGTEPARPAIDLVIAPADPAAGAAATVSIPSASPRDAACRFYAVLAPWRIVDPANLRLSLAPPVRR